MEDVMDWLEPSITKRIDHITELVEKKTENIDAEFKMYFEALKSRHKDSINELLVLESLFARRAEIIEAAYRFGLKDGIGLKVLK